MAKTRILIRKRNGGQCLLEGFFADKLAKWLLGSVGVDLDNSDMAHHVGQEHYHRVQDSKQYEQLSMMLLDMEANTEAEDQLAADMEAEADGYGGDDPPDGADAADGGGPGPGPEEVDLDPDEDPVPEPVEDETLASASRA